MTRWRLSQAIHGRDIIRRFMTDGPREVVIEVDTTKLDERCNGAVTLLHVCVVLSAVVFCRSVNGDMITASGLLRYEQINTCSDDPLPHQDFDLAIVDGNAGQRMMLTLDDVQERAWGATVDNMWRIENESRHTPFFGVEAGRVVVERNLFGDLETLELAVMRDYDFCRESNAARGGTYSMRVWQSGDANQDHVFDSSDLVQVFGAGQYETDQPATWASGDWNGDTRFNSSDLIDAFVEGAYSQPRAAAVPEPSSVVLLLIGMCLIRRY